MIFAEKKMRSEFNYTPDTKMFRLVSDDYRLLHVLSRFGIRMGFGDDTVREVCVRAGVDTFTFLSVVNYVINGYAERDELEKLHLPTLLGYLHHSHKYFLGFLLPAIRRKLLEGIRLRTSDISYLIIKFFDEYFTEVKAHMDSEESTVFRYVGDLISGGRIRNREVSTYSRHHKEVSSRLGELKKLILKYTPEDADANLLNSALYDIYRCEQELNSHCLVEDKLFVPAVRILEEKLREGR